MPTPEHWQGYDPQFLEDFDIPMPALGKWAADAAINRETGGSKLPFQYFTSIQSASRRLPIVCAANIFRDKFIPIGREGNFQKDDRLQDSEQLITTIYTRVNHGHDDAQRKMAKGHMVRREDVQWDTDGDQDRALAASISTFHYSNACPQHQSVNNGVWKQLENSILVRGRSREPRKATVFTGPILSTRDPLLVIPNDEETEIQCPLRFWKVVYYVKEDNRLYYAAFIMSHKEEVEDDGYVNAARLDAMKLILEAEEKPFLEFDERQTYQVNISKIEAMTGLKFKKAIEALPEDEQRKLSIHEARFIGEHLQTFESFINADLVEGLVV